MLGPQALTPFAPSPRTRRLIAATALSALIVLAMAVVYLLVARRDAETAALERVGLYSRALESQTAGFFEEAAILMDAVSDILEVNRETLDPVSAGRLLKDSVTGKMTLRSLSLLDREGRVLASTDANTVDIRVNLALLGGIPVDGRPRIGPLLPGRDLSDTVAPTVSKGTFALPLVKRVNLSGPDALLLVALLNPDRIATQHAVLIGDAADHSALFSFDGQLLGAGLDIPIEPGTRPDGLIPFRRFLPAQEHGTYIDAGLGGSKSFSAFRTLRRWPLVVVVEQPYTQIWTTLRPVFGWAAACTLIAWMAIGLAAFLIRRQMRQQEATERKVVEANAELARTEERWKLALEGSDQGVWDIDLRAQNAKVSVRLMKMLGYQEGEFEWTAEKWRSLVHPDDILGVIEAAEAHIAGRSPSFEKEMRLLTGNGSWKWVLASGQLAPQIPGSSRPARMIGTNTDISDRKRTEEALRSSQARQQAILRSALDGIVTIDLDGNVLDLNPAAEKMFGHPRASIVGKPMHDMLVPPKYRQAHVEGMARYRATGDGPVLNQRVEIEAMRADGSIFPVELAIVPIRTDSGEIFTATIRDISDRMRAEYALRSSEARFRATFEQAAVGVLHQAADRRFLRVNQTLCRMLGYSREEFLALDADRLVHPEEATEGLASMKQLFAGEIDNFAQDKRYRRKDGIYQWVRLTASLARNENGQALYMICVVEDITAQKKAREELAAARQIELEIGNRIQQSLLVAPPSAQIDGLWMSAFNQASTGIDGDFLEVIKFGDHALDVIVGDVMGKGVPAALLGAATKLQFSRSMAELLSQQKPGAEPPHPCDIVASVNHAMTPHLQALEAFVTLVYLRIDTRTDTVTWVGCGHEEPLLIGRGGEIQTFKNQLPPIGVFSTDDVAQDSRTLLAGDAVFLCSDGAADALLPDGTRLGRDRLNESVRSRMIKMGKPAMALHSLRNSLLQDVDIADDLTTVLLVRHDENRPIYRLEVPVNLSALGLIRDFVTEHTKKAAVPDDTAGPFVVAAVEVMTNIIRHATGRLSDAPVELFIRHKAGGLILETSYLGDPYAPPVDAPDTDLSTFPEGGFGLFIIRNACDKVEYRSSDGVNTVRMTLLNHALAQDTGASIRSSR